MIKPLDVECEKCGAMPFTPCRVKRGLVVAYYYGWKDFHAARVRAAEREEKEKGK